MESNGKAVARNMIWNSFGSLFYLGCQWILTILVTRIAGFYDAGVLSLAMSVSAMFQTVAVFGIRNFQVSDVDNQFSASTYVGFRNLTCIFSFLLCTVAAFLLRYNGEQILAILFFMVFRIAESYSDVLYGIAQKEGRLDINGKAFTIKGALLLPSFLLPYLLTRSLWMALAFMALSSCLSTVFYDLIVVRRLASFKLYDRIGNCLTLAKKTLPLVAYLFLFSTITTIPKLLLKEIYDESALGAYSSIFSIAMLFQIATNYIYTPFIHVFATYYKQRDVKKFFLALSKVLAAICAMAILVFAAAALFGEFAFVLVFGESIREFMYLVNPILISIFIMSIAGFLFMLEVVVRDFKGLLIGNAVSFAVCVLISPYMIRRFELNGTSYALILSSLLGVVIVGIGIVLRIRSKKEETYE